MVFPWLHDHCIRRKDRMSSLQTKGMMRGGSVKRSPSAPSRHIFQKEDTKEIQKNHPTTKRSNNSTPHAGSWNAPMHGSKTTEGLRCGGITLQILTRHLLNLRVFSSVYGGYEMTSNMIFAIFILFITQLAFLLLVRKARAKILWKISLFTSLLSLLLVIKLHYAWQFYLSYMMSGVSMFSYWTAYNLAYFRGTPKEKRGLGSAVMCSG